MIRRLRWKVVGLNMGMVFCVLLAVFAAVFFFARSALSRSVRQQMEEAVRTGVYDLSQPAGSTLPCFVAEVYASGTVRVSGNGYYDLTDKSALADIVTAALSAQEDEGVLADYHLRYLRSVGLLSTRIAFTDSTLEQATLRSLLTGSLLIGLAALAVLLMQTAPHLFLSLWGARPVPIVLLVVCVALCEGAQAGAIIGALSGLLWGIYSFRLFGFDALVLMLIGLTAGLLVEWLLRANLLTALLLCTGASLAQALLEWLFCYVLFFKDPEGPRLPP